MDELKAIKQIVNLKKLVEHIDIEDCIKSSAMLESVLEEAKEILKEEK